MDVKSIQELIKLINRTNLTDVEIEQEGFRLRVQRKPAENIVYNTAPSAVPVVASSSATIPVAPSAKQEEKVTTEVTEKKNQEKETEESSELYTFKSPIIGTFYRASGPDKDPFVKVGDMISSGQVLCIIEAMKLFNEIESDIEGKIVKILVENAQPVEYDQPLFLIDRS